VPLITSISALISAIDVFTPADKFPKIAKVCSLILSAEPLKSILLNSSCAAYIAFFAASGIS